VGKEKVGVDNTTYLILRPLFFLCGIKIVSYVLLVNVILPDA